MNKFKVYWKYEYNRDNEPMVIGYDRIEIKDNLFVLYHENNSIAQDCYLSFESVAAIIPERQKELRNPIEFQIFLRKRQKPITIFAHNIKSSGDRIQFIGRHYDQFTQETNEQVIDGIHVLASEVIAIFPHTKLVTEEG